MGILFGKELLSYDSCRTLINEKLLVEGVTINTYDIQTFSMCVVKLNVQ